MPGKLGNESAGYGESAANDYSFSDDDDISGTGIEFTFDFFPFHQFSQLIQCQTDDILVGMRAEKLQCSSSWLELRVHLAKQWQTNRFHRQ